MASSLGTNAVIVTRVHWTLYGINATFKDCPGFKLFISVTYARADSYDLRTILENLEGISVMYARADSYDFKTILENLEGSLMKLKLASLAKKTWHLRIFIFYFWA